MDSETPARMEKNMVGYICSYIIALIAVAAGVFCMIYPFYHKIVCKMPTTATVIDIQERWSHDDDDSSSHLVYYPVFQYWANGEMITIEHNVSPSPYQVGDQVEMLYNADNPQQYYIPDSAGGNWAFLLGGALFFVMGLGFIILLTKTWLLPIILGK